MRMVRIWVVEDNNADAFLIELSLRRTGLLYEQTTITDGESALKAIRACQSGTASVPNIILLDLNLPRFDGIDVLHALRETSVFDKVGIAVFSSLPKAWGELEKYGVKRFQKHANLEQFLLEVRNAVTELLQPRPPPDDPAV